MRPVILTLVGFFLLSINGFGQIAGLPYSVKNAQSFLGEWCWNSGTSSFKVILKEVNYFDASTQKIGKVIGGWHSYTEKGNLVESSCEFISDTINKSTTLIGVALNDTLLNLNIKDLTANRLYGVAMRLIPNSFSQAIWTLETKEVIRVNDIRVYPELQTLPSNIILTLKK